MIKQVNIKHISNLHNEWLRGLEFYGQELFILQERLDEIATDNTGKEVLVKIDYFQNEIIIHQNAIDELKHLIHANIKKIEQQLLKTELFVEENTAIEHEQLGEQYETEEKMINDLRHEFNRFAAEWM
jgi:hypothetical protein